MTAGRKRLPNRRAGEAVPVELLRDRRGIYGIGVSRDYEAQAQARGIDSWECEHRPRSLIIRPDRLSGKLTASTPGLAVLQRISARSIFSRSTEEQLRRFIHHEALWRAGLPWPPPRHDNGHCEYWSADKKQQVRNRGIYHGLRLCSLYVINNLVGQTLEAAADVDALKEARRFYFGYREHIYRAGALSRRALQLINTFPVLGLTIYSYHRPPESEYGVRAEQAAELVERGARLREVAAVMGIPMALRRIKPGAAHWATDTLFQHPQLLDFMPETLPRSRIWLWAVYWAHKLDAGFGEWAAREVPHIPGRQREVAVLLMDIGDWVRTGTAPVKPKEIHPDEWAIRRQFVTRPFTPSMSLKTVTALSAAWRKAVTSHTGGPDLTFPTPWYPAGMVGDYEILPIDISAEVYREGAATHHCVRTYVNDIQHGGLYLYSVRRDNERVATVALTRNANCASLGEIRGPCNAQPTKEVVSMVRRWLRAQGPLPSDGHQPGKPETGISSQVAHECQAARQDQCPIRMRHQDVGVGSQSRGVEPARLRSP
jgi:hypothetical protein